MTSAHPNYIFGIITQHFNSGYHVFGAIFKINAQGKAEDFTPIDFDGKTIREHFTDNFGRAEPTLNHFARGSKALFFPITEKSAALIREKIEDLRPLLKEGKNPYYFCPSGVEYDPKLERKGTQPIGYDGKPRDVGKVDYDSFERSPDSAPRAATNCMKFLLNTLEKVGGVPISKMGVGNDMIPLEGTPQDLRHFIERAAGNSGKMAIEKTHGKLNKTVSGNMFCAYDQGDSDTSITGIVNDLLVDSHHQLKPERDPRTGKTNQGLMPVIDLFMKDRHPWVDTSHDIVPTANPKIVIHPPVTAEMMARPRSNIQVDPF